MAKDWRAAEADVEAVLAARQSDPFAVLGPHEVPGGWAIRAFVPFAKTKTARLASGDPRLSIEERYGTHEKYVAQVRAAAERLVRGRYLLQDDADRLLAQAEAGTVLK